jgi:hypothetical protein
MRRMHCGETCPSRPKQRGSTSTLSLDAINPVNLEIQLIVKSSHPS